MEIVIVDSGIGPDSGAMANGNRLTGGNHCSGQTGMAGDLDGSLPDGLEGGGLADADQITLGTGNDGRMVSKHQGAASRQVQVDGAVHAKRRWN